MLVMARDIAAATKGDTVLCQVLQHVKSGWPEEVDDERLRPFFSKRWELTMERDCLLWGWRVVIPDPLHGQILEELHVAHPSIVRMKEITRSHVWWPKIDSDIEATVRQCGSCQET